MSLALLTEISASITDEVLEDFLCECVLDVATEEGLQDNPSNPCVGATLSTHQHVDQHSGNTDNHREQQSKQSSAPELLASGVTYPSRELFLEALNLYKNATFQPFTLRSSLKSKPNGSLIVKCCHGIERMKSITDGNV